MKPVVSTGDLTLIARTATPETFAPFGRLLLPGDRMALGDSGGVVVRVDKGSAGARRVTSLKRCPEARRMLIAPQDVSMWIVVLGASASRGPPLAFVLSPGSAVLIEAGVWHSGPVPLGEGTVVELLETPGTADRLDRLPLRDLVGAEGARVVLPEEPGAPAPGLDLDAPYAVLLDAALTGRLRLALLAFSALEIGEASPQLRAETDEVTQGIRSMWGRAADLGELPGVRASREFLTALGANTEHVRPASEVLLQRVLDGRSLPDTNTLVDAVRLCVLRMGVPFSLFDAARVGTPLLARLGAPGESYKGPRGAIRLDGRPVLCDPAGPFASPFGDAARVRPRGVTRRAVVALYLSPETDAKTAGALLDGVAKAVARHCGGTRAADLVLG